MKSITFFIRQGGHVTLVVGLVEEKVWVKSEKKVPPHGE